MYLRWLIAATFLLALPALAFSDEPKETRVTAPKNTARYAGGLGGSYFVDQQLLKDYQAIKENLSRLHEEIKAGEATSTSALKRLQEIETEATVLRATIEATKTFVAAFKTYKKTETQIVPLADSRRIIVVGDNVTMRGWEGPGIKIVLEKIVLGTEPPTADEFKAISLEHEVKVLTKLVGKTPAERAADNKEFRESEAGKKMTEAELVARETFWKEQFSGYNVFADFQGKAANVLSVVGLQYDQGNRQISSCITSPGGGATVGSEWKRHASVTIYVPPCEHVLVAGCQVKLDIQKLNCNLLLSTSHSRDRNYNGSFEVRSIKGNVTIDQAPVRVLEDVTGDVSATMTDEFVNAGTNHSGGFRTSYSYDTANTQFNNISGKLTAHFLRTQLALGDIAGAINLQNEFGNTKLHFNEGHKIESAMRIISQSGKIEFKAPPAVLSSIPIYAYTLCGTIRTDLGREVLDDVSFSTGNPRRSWSGFVTPSKDRFSLEKFERPAKALKNSDRKPGLDLISKSGRVSILQSAD